MVGAGIYLTTDPSVHKLKEVLPINLSNSIDMQKKRSAFRTFIV